MDKPCTSETIEKPTRQDHAHRTPAAVETIYRIRVEGHLDDDWSAWLTGVSIVNEPDGTAVLTVSLPDQAALHGLLVRIRDLALPLVSINRVRDRSSQ